MKRLLRREEGSALVTAILLSAIMMGAVTTTYAYVDQQQEESGVERVRESSFNLAEGAMTAQIVRLAQGWRGRGTATVTSDFTDCTETSTDAYCPVAAELLSSFASVDTAAPNGTYRIEVRDSVGGEEFFSATTAGRSHYDQDGDGKVWVRAEATVRGRSRSVIARVEVQEQPEELPRHALMAGRLSLKNKGNKVLLEPRFGSQRGPITVRCVVTENASVPCLGHDPYDDDLFANQVPGVDPVEGASLDPVIDPEALARLKARAQADGTYYTGCPDSLTGAVVVVVSCTKTFNGKNTYNSAERPGLLIWMSGALEISGTTTFYGVVYHENNPAVTGTVVTVQGNGKIRGGVIVEGLAGVEVGSSGGCGGNKDCTQADANLEFDPNAFTSVSSYGSAGIVQNTFRELSVNR